ncbi:hypothetical protein [Oleisolibacter albus]|uniref:hypothetical protein n=1 Tax=Oleisolibacter albus TaxID=2171757 RepID=UPI000DF18C54|nr:hypothetical protein [Oleisolibacter albus]
MSADTATAFAASIRQDAALMARLSALSGREALVSALADEARTRGLPLGAAEIEADLDRHLGEGELDDSALDLVNGGSRPNCSAPGKMDPDDFSRQS